MRRKGLTLMELLTVISILATLAALMYPVFLRVRSRVYVVSCASQLRQIGLAIRMYVKDYCGEDTPYCIPISLGLLYPNYVKDKNLLVCPYFQTLAPEVVEEMHQASQARWGELWSSYFIISPRGIDSIAKTEPGWVSFSEIFAKLGDSTPIVYCDAHRTGCPLSNFPFHFNSLKGRAFAENCINLFSPGDPYIILRWGGSVHLVYKHGYWLGGNRYLIDEFLMPPQN